MEEHLAVRRTHCLSFDIEEHFQVAAFDSPARRRQWVSLESRVERNTEKILECLDVHQVKATMFVLGWVAERCPKLVRRMAEGGHEIASHGYGHDLVTVLTREQFREDIKRAKAVLEDTIGMPVLGYRAPTFTITQETLWALPILLEEGYAYDSSIFPVYHDQYGIPGANPSPHLISTHSGTLWEVPPSTCKLGWTRIPIAGGGYFRFFPFWLIQYLMRKVEREGESIVFYLHPWEFDADQPRMSGPFRSRLRHYFNLDKTERRFHRLIEAFPFAPIRESIPMIGQLYNHSEYPPNGVFGQMPVSV